MRSADVISHCKIKEVLKDLCSKCYFILVFSTVTYNRERPKTLKGHLVLVQKSIRNIPVLNKGWDLRCGSLKFFTTAHLDQKGGDYSPSYTYTWISGVHQCSYLFHWLQKSQQLSTYKQKYVAQKWQKRHLWCHKRLIFQINYVLFNVHQKTLKKRYDRFRKNTKQHDCFQHW